MLTIEDYEQYKEVIYIEPTPGNGEGHLLDVYHKLTEAGLPVHAAGYGYPPIYVCSPTAEQYQTILEVAQDFKDEFDSELTFAPAHRVRYQQDGAASETEKRPQPHEINPHCIRLTEEEEAIAATMHIPDAAERSADESGDALLDVFLAHNSQDKPFVRAINEKLKARGLTSWIDEEQIRPGASFQESIESAIPRCKTAAIFVGQTIGRVQIMEIRVFINRSLSKQIHTIPVLLPGVDSLPDNLLFLQELNWVQFTDEADEAALDKLIWGITGVNPHTGETAAPSSESSDASNDSPSETQPTTAKETDSNA